MDPAENQDGQHLIQHCVIIQRDEKGYGLTVTGDNPVYVQSVKEGGAAHRTGVQVGDKIIKVNGTLVTHYNHIEVVNLIKSGSYVALTLLGKPPAHLQAERQAATSPSAIVLRDPVKDERTVAIQRVLTQEREFYKKTKEEYMRKPSDKLQKELAESTTRIKALDAELTALIQSQQPEFSYNGPFSAPPGKTAPQVWQPVTQISNRCHSHPADDNYPLDQDPNALYDNYPPSAITGEPMINMLSGDAADKDLHKPTSPPQPPERKFPPTGDQLVPLSNSGSFTNAGKKRHKKFSLPEGATHVRQGSSPAAFFRPMLNGSPSDKSFPVRDNGKKKSFDDVTGMSKAYAYLASPNKSWKNPLTSLPKAWIPHSHENKAMQINDVNGKSSMHASQSPPPTPTPTLSEPMEKRSRNDTGEICAEEDDETQSSQGDANKLGVMQHGQSNNSIISMEDDDFASDDEKIDDHGPFNSLNMLKNKPAHLAVFLHYLISNNDPSSLFFWLVTDSYKEGTPKEMKKWSYEIYSTFLADRAPLKVDMDKETIVEPIESCLGSEDNLKDVFQRARNVAGEEIGELLADFRSKRALGLGSLFGDHQLEDDGMDKGKELQVVEQTLMPHLESILAELDANTTADASQVDRNSAMASALTTFLKQVGLTIKQQGNNANVLERYSSFTRKENKSLFKIRGSKKIKGHHFNSVHYTSPTFCNHCNGLLWGIGDQGFQCSTCEYNVHKGNCFEAIEDCPGPKKKRKPRKPSLPVDSYGSNDEHESENGGPADNKIKSGSFDEDIISGGRENRMAGDESSRVSDREPFGEEGMPRHKSTSELFLDKPHLAKVVGRSESMKTSALMAETLLKYVTKRRNRSSDGSVDGKVNSPESKKAKSTSDPDPDLSVESDEHEDSDIVLTALELTDDLNGILKGILEKLKKLDTIESTVKKIEGSLDKLEERTKRLEALEITAREDIDNLKINHSLIEKNLDDANKALDKKIQNLDGKVADLQDKEKKINQVLEDLNTKDLYLEAYSRRENIKFNNIAESPSPRNGVEDTEEVLRTFLDQQLGYRDARSVEIQRVHRLGKRKEDGGARPILARFLRYKDCEQILALGSRLRGTNFQMFRDLPQELVKRRSRQMDTFKKAKRNNIPVSFSKSQPDKLFIRGKFWPVGQVLDI